MAVTKKVLTVCPYCGVGCGLYLVVEDNRVVGVEPDGLHPVNEGQLCVKGYYGYHFINDPNRLKSPLIKKNGQFETASWDEALDYVAGRLAQIRQESGPDAFAMTSCARATNEENYLAQKFARAVIGTNNIDNCARV